MNIQKAYNAWAKQYDINQNKTRDLDIISTKKTLEKYRFSKVLELGSGTGKNTQWLLTKADEIIGLDFSEEMMCIAKEKISDTRVVFKNADLNGNWDIENIFFDLITSSLTLEHISNLNHIFEQANKKLEKKGLFFISELHPYKQYAGSGARYTTKEITVRLKVFQHHLTDYLESASANNFELVEIKEWFDEMTENEIPRLISFVFKKKI